MERFLEFVEKPLSATTRVRELAVITQCPRESFLIKLHARSVQVETKEKWWRKETLFLVPSRAHLEIISGRQNENEKKKKKNPKKKCPPPPTDGA